MLSCLLSPSPSITLFQSVSFGFFCRFVSAILPLSLFTMLLLVQLRHYATSHTSFFTRHRAIMAMDKFTDEFALTKFEKDLIRKPQTARVIDNMLTKPLYPRSLCPC